MTLLTEIYEQPEVIERVLLGGRDAVRAAAGLLREASFVVIAARGTSDNAARYAKYLWEAHNRIPVSLAAPSVFSVYRSPPRLRGAIVVGLSQSGESPDIVAVLAEGRRQGCPTVAITNAPGSPLARAADVVIDIGAGVEAAVAATKSYTAQLLAISMISVEAAEDPVQSDRLTAVPGWMRQALGLDDRMSGIARHYCGMERCVVLGRGFHYSTAFEWSLKIKELAYIAAEPYSSADFRHGPIAMVGGGFRALAVAHSGEIFPDMLELLTGLKSGQEVGLAVISDHPKALELADDPIPLPAGIPEWISPLVAIVPAQLFAYHLTCACGFDPDAPRGLQKITRTK